MHYWLVLLFASACEVMWAMTLKGLSDRSHWSVWLFASSAFLTVLNIILLSYVMRGIPASTAYAVWTGLGAAGLAVVGMFAFGESVNLLRLGSLALVIVGVVGLKLSQG